MGISCVSISNFKSFKEVHINLEKLNIVIGANASGKSNFVQFFRFLRDLTNFGLENAISMQGGIDYFLNINIGISKEFKIEVKIETFERHLPILLSPEKQIGFDIYEMIYKLAVKFGRIKSRWEIREDSLTLKSKFKNYIHWKEEEKECEDLGEGEIVFSGEGDRISLSLIAPKEVKEKEEDIFIIKSTRDFLKRVRLSQGDVVIQMPQWFYFGGLARKTFESISIYDFDPKVCKKAQLITGKADLEEDGSNLTVVINNLLRRGQRQRFYSILSDLLPFVDRINTRTFANNLIFQLREKYYKYKSLPSFLVSDGTVNLTALIVALFFQERKLKVIEEPERNLHPYLISKVVDIMRDASEKGQIITTSHNPEIVRYADPDEIFLVHRTSEGYSEISKPVEAEEIKVFLDKELGLSELYVQNLLEAYVR